MDGHRIFSYMLFVLLPFGAACSTDFEDTAAPAANQVDTAAPSANDDLALTSATLDGDIPPCGNNLPLPPRPPWWFFTAIDDPLTIPDNNARGVSSVVNVTQTGLTIQRVGVSVDITHTFVGDLVIQVIAPNGQIATLSNRQGGSADNFVVTALDISRSFTPGSSASGSWRLFVRDLAPLDTGRINSFCVTIGSST